MTSARVVGTQGVAREVREAQILSEAVIAFGQQGYGQTSLAFIAARAGVSKTLVVAYFGTKQELYLRSVRIAGERLGALIGSIVERGDTSIEGPIRTVEALLESVDVHPHDWALLYDESAPSDDAVLVEVHQFRSAMRQFAVMGSQLFLGPDAHEMEYELLATAWIGILTHVMRWYQQNPDLNPAEVARHAASTMRRVTRS